MTGSGAAVGAGSEQQMSEFTEVRRPTSDEPDTTSSGTIRASGHEVPNLLAIAVLGHT